MLFWLRPWDKLLSWFFSSIWRDTQIGLLEPFFCSNSGNPKLRIFNLLLLWNQKFSEVNSIFMHFVTFFSSALALKSHSFEFIHCRFLVCIFSPFFGLKPISNAWVIIYFQPHSSVSSFLYRAWITFPKLQVVYFLTMMVFVLEKQSSV